MIRFLLLAYPRAWRLRYGEELTQLVQDGGFSPRIALDVFVAGLAERRRSIKSSLTGGIAVVVGPAWRHPLAFAAIAMAVLTPVTLFVVGSILTYQLGVDFLRGPLEAIGAGQSGAGRLVDLGLVLSPAVALLLAALPLIRFGVQTSDAGREAVLGVRLKAANALIGLLALVIGGVLVWHIVFESVIERGG